MVIPLSPGTSAAQLGYATGIASALSSVWLWDPSYAMAVGGDPAVYEKLLRDATISGAFDHLQRSIVGHDFSFEPHDPEDPKHRQLAKLLEQATKQMRGFSQALYNLSRASLMGSTWGLIDPETKEIALGDGKVRTWTIVKRLRDVDKRRFRLSRVGLTTVQAGMLDGSTQQPNMREVDRLRLDMERQQGLAMGGAAAQDGWHWEFHRGPSFWWQPLEACCEVDRWVQHIVDTSERGLGYGYGLADDIYFFFWSKQQILRFGLQGLERWGQGFLYAKIKALRDGFAKGQNQSGAIQQTLEWLRKQRSENLSVVDADTDLALLDMPATGNVQCLAWIEYLDREIVKRILTALRPTGGGGEGQGGYSQAAKEEDSTDTTVAYLRSPLEETWTHNVAAYFVRHNQANLAELGLAGIPAPRLRLRGKEKRDPEIVLKILETMQRLGLPMVKSEVYRLLAITQPNDDHGDDVIEFPKPVMGADQDHPVGLDGAPKPMREPVGGGSEAVGDRSVAA